MAARLLAAGASLSKPADAQVILINTCTVTSEADAKSRKALRRSLEKAQDAVVIVCGCGATVDPAQFEDIPGKRLVIADKELALQKALEILVQRDGVGLVQRDGVGVPLFETKSGTPTPSLCTKPTPSLCTKPTPLSIGEGFNTRVQVKVQDGCDNSCSYCIVPQARGRAQSMSLPLVLAEIQALMQAGAQEIVLTGIDLGNYQDGQNSLEVLLSKALRLEGTCRFRLSSIELPGITHELVQLIADSKGRICAHLHVPLQSGSDAVLQAMNRRYSAADFQSKISNAREVLPQLSLTTDVIVGFPGESEEDFALTIALSKELLFSRMHVFRYSKRPGTPAAELPRQLSQQAKAERSKALRRLAEELTVNDAQKRIGTTEQVLMESAHKGRSESYYPVQVKEKAEPGSLTALKIVGYENGQLIGVKG